ncbi:MAG: hypothetical protein I3270_01820 [Candidatus Moeniiplasma glomeromycotorum]|nr:hypothetical protein [Candidatus Moeniiplasma glomeromycotorum]MCE8162440.1 hypothetical protein [Candidatus Moeniiplasma glomeromycotorum]MCE8166366.1 hypothetical protein [Candidatus Moeniiplasma glomeromycotorum]MCE8166848.1 hypothetical protein [Candidatus Moeniiplasma glomeromycotorum]
MPLPPQTEREKELIRKNKNLEASLGNANSELNKLKDLLGTDDRKGLAKEVKELQTKLTKTEKILNGTEELLNGQRDKSEEVYKEIEASLDRADKIIKEQLLKEIERLEIIIKKLETELKKANQSAENVWVKSLAIAGVFSTGAWAIVGVTKWIQNIRVGKNNPGTPTTPTE